MVVVQDLKDFNNNDDDDNEDDRMNNKPPCSKEGRSSTLQFGPTKTSMINPIGVGENRNVGDIRKIQPSKPKGLRYKVCR